MSLDNKIKSIEERNKRVELDKKWETSFARKLVILVITYLVAAIYMKYFLHDPHWYLGSLVPTGGYFLSTLSLPFIRKFWQKNQ